jgi:hypothetical protein
VVELKNRNETAALGLKPLTPETTPCKRFGRRLRTVVLRAPGNSWLASSSVSLRVAPAPVGAFLVEGRYLQGSVRDREVLGDTIPIPRSRRLA